MPAHTKTRGFHVCRRWVVIELCLHQQHAVASAALEIFATSTEGHMYCMNVTKGFVISCRFVTVVVVAVVVLNAHDVLDCIRICS